jgi:thioredoxin-like negative regulator of GroEL
MPEGHWLVAASATPLAATLTALRRFEEAEALLVGALRTFEDTFGVDNDRAGEARKRLAELYEATGRTDLAAGLRTGT